MAIRIERIPIKENLNFVDDPTVKKVEVKVVDETSGPVTTTQKIKKYYKALISLIGSLAASLVAAQGVPGLPDKIRGWLVGLVLFLTFFGVILKKNEDWVNGL